MSFQAVANQPNAARPTGELGVVNGLQNPIEAATGPGTAISGNYGGGAYQQINIGDIAVQYYDAIFGSIAVPSCVWTGATQATAAAASEAALAAIHGNALVNAANIASPNGVYRGFLGLFMQYRDPNDGGYGRPTDKRSIAPGGRAKMRISPNDYNFSNWLPAGTLVGVAVNVTIVGTGTYSAIPSANQVQTTLVSTGTTAGSTVAAVSTVLAAEYAIGKLAYDKAANDTFVYVDFAGSVTNPSGGVQEINTAS